MSMGLIAAMTSVMPATAQPLLYAQRLPEGTVYVRLANALPDAAKVQTDFAGTVELGSDGAARISPYFVAGQAGGNKVAMQVAAGGKTATAMFEPKSGTFITVVLSAKGDGVGTAIITDKPDYNQLKARLTFYNATADCTAGSPVGWRRASGVRRDGAGFGAGAGDQPGGRHRHRRLCGRQGAGA